MLLLLLGTVCAFLELFIRSSRTDSVVISCRGGTTGQHVEESYLQTGHGYFVL